MMLGCDKPLSIVPRGYCQCGCGAKAAISTKRSRGEHYCRYRPCHRAFYHEIRSYEDRVQEFWAHADKSGDCWTWTGAQTPRGYGRFKIGKLIWLAHRFAYEVAYGKAPGEMFVCHRCDNPPCVRPEHLFLGTSFDNVRDKIRKGRANSPRGEKNRHARLTDERVLEIRRTYSEGHLTQKRLALLVGVHPHYMREILIGKWWTHVPVFPRPEGLRGPKPTRR